LYSWHYSDWFMNFLFKGHRIGQYPNEHSRLKIINNIRVLLLWNIWILGYLMQLLRFFHFPLWILCMNWILVCLLIKLLDTDTDAGHNTDTNTATLIIIWTPNIDTDTRQCLTPTRTHIGHGHTSVSDTDTDTYRTRTRLIREVYTLHMLLLIFCKGIKNLIETNDFSYALKVL
jgi:hypothetical protein